VGFHARYIKRDNLRNKYISTLFDREFSSESGWFLPPRKGKTLSWGATQNESFAKRPEVLPTISYYAATAYNVGSFTPFSEDDGRPCQV